MENVEEKVLKKFNVDTEPKICDEEGCENEAEVKGKCRKCYAKRYWKDKGKAKREARGTEKVESISDPDKIANMRFRLQIEKEELEESLNEVKKKLASIDDVLDLLEERRKEDEND